MTISCVLGGILVECVGSARLEGNSLDTVTNGDIAARDVLIITVLTDTIG